MENKGTAMQDRTRALQIGVAQAWTDTFDRVNPSMETPDHLSGLNLNRLNPSEQPPCPKLRGDLGPRASSSSAV